MPRKKWSEIRSKAAPETLEAAARKKEALLAVMELNELRRVRNLTQEQLADRLGVRQTNVSRLENRSDMHISTLRAVIEAMGGELEITARFSDGAYRIDPFARAED